MRWLRIRARAVKPFSVMAYQAQGIRRLGVLRMDVENPGKLFQEGLGANTSLARVAGLSFAISLYFEGWVGVIADAVTCCFRHPDYPQSDWLYAIYSGGDDCLRRQLECRRGIGRARAQ